MELELMQHIYDFLESLTGSGWESTNQLIAYIFTIICFFGIIKFILSIFGLGTGIFKSKGK